MHVTVRATGATLGTASAQLVGNNIEAYENTIPCMLSDRLRNPKFAGPPNPQTGLAPEWEPAGNNMSGMRCHLVPGMFLSGYEAQLIHNYADGKWCGIVQALVHVRKGEEFEVEVWARAQHRPVTFSVELRLGRGGPLETGKGVLTCDVAHWQRLTCRITAPETSDRVYFQISIPADSILVIDQIHLRPIGETHVCQAMLDSFSQYPCPVLRFPGGSMTNHYHWQCGTGPVHLRPVLDDPVFKYKIHYDFGTDEFLELCAARDIRPLITLNIATATPEENAAWAAYIRAWYVTRGLPVPATYIMVGNEQYYFHEHGHMTGEMYVRALEAFVPPIRAAYPEARIMAIGEFESAGLRAGQATPLRQAVLEKAQDLFDVLVVTRYSGCGSDPAFDKCLTDVANSLVARREDITRQIDTMRAAGCAKPIGIVEWNLFTQASHNDHLGFYEPSDIRHCLYAAGYLNAFARQGEAMEVACFYSLINTMGCVHVHDGQVTLTDLVTVFNWYAEALPGTVPAVDIASPMLTEKAPAIDAVFLRKDGTTYGFLVNLHATEHAEVSLEGLGTVTEARGLTADAILTALSPVTVTHTASSVTLPPASLVRITMT